MVNKKKAIENIFFTLFMIIMAILIFITIQARIMGREPSLLGHRLYVVDSGSMSPTLKIGTLIMVKEIEPKGIIDGDIITYRGSGDSVVTHRVMEVEYGGASFITKGDANETEDPMPLDSNKLIGKVVFSIPYIGLLLKLLQTKVGLIGIVILVFIGVIIQATLTKKEKDKAGNKGGEESNHKVFPL